MQYKAFMSYSHTADAKLASAIQSSLHKFTKPWYQLRAVRVFRDTTNISVTPALWNSITKALDDSEYFILMASSEAAKSPWVEKEVNYWLLNRPVDKLLIVLTGGQLAWDNDIAQPDFDWTKTDAVPLRLKGVFQQEPKYVDLRWAKTAEDLSMRNLEFRGAIADLASVLHGLPMDVLDGEDVRQYNKARRLAYSAVCILALLTLLSTTAAVFAFQQQREASRQRLLAEQQRNEAEERRREAERQRQEADKQRSIAEEQRREALHQRQVAIINGQRAEERRREADRQRVIAEQKTAEAKRQNYLANVANVMVADEGVRVSESDGIQRRLASSDERLRNWEWHHLQLRLDNSLLTIRGEEGAITRVEEVAFSPDGSRIVSASWDGTIRVWDAKTGKPLLNILGDDIFTSASFSPNGSRIVSGSWDKTVCVWDAGSGKLLMRLEGHQDWVSSVAFSRDGRKIFSISEKDKTFRSWDAETGKLLAVVHPSAKDTDSIIAFSLDGVSVVESVGNKNEAQIRDLTAMNSLVPLQGHGRPVSTARFSQDGRQVATGSYDKSIRVWEVKSGKLLFTLLGHQSEVKSLAFSPTGKLLVSGASDGLRVWNLETGAQIALLQGHQGLVNTVSFNPDSQLIVSGSNDSTIRTWNVTTAANLNLPVATENIYSVAFSRAGKHIALGGRDSEIQVFEVETLKEVGSWKAYVGAVLGLDFRSDGSQLAVAGANGSVRIYEVGSGELLGTLRGHNSAVDALAYSADGKYLATGTWDGTVRVWEVATWKLLWAAKGHSDLIDQLVYSPDAKWLASASWDKTVKVWAAATGQEHLTLTGHGQSVACVAFSPDGNRIASGSFDRSIRIWDANNGAALRTLLGHTGQIIGITFSADGHRLLSASGDDTLRFWEAETGETIATLRDAQAKIDSFAVSADVTKIAVGLSKSTVKESSGGSLMIWSKVMPTDRFVVGVRPASEAEKAKVRKKIEEPKLPLQNIIKLLRNPQVLDGRGAQPAELGFEKPLDLEDASVRSYIRRSKAYSDRKDYDLAIADLDRAIGLDSKNGEAYGARAMAYYFAGDDDRAVADLGKAIGLDKERVHVYLLLRGNIYSRNNDLEKALSDFDKAIQLTPDYYLHYAQRGDVYFKRGEYDRAIADFDQAIKRSPTDHRFYNQRGEAFYYKGENQRALADFETAVRLNGNSAPSRNNLACLLFDLGRFEQALMHWDRLLGAYPNNSFAMAGKSITLDALGKREQALSVFKQLVTRDQGFWDCASWKKEHFWTKSGCRAIAPLANALRASETEVPRNSSRP